MSAIKTILSTCLGFYNTQIVIEPYSFSVWQVVLGCAFLGLALFFVRKVFTD